MPTQAELKAQRRAESEKELEKRKEQAEKGLKKVVPITKGTIEKIKERKKLLESI